MKTQKRFGKREGLDEQGRGAYGAAVSLVPLTRRRAGLGVQAACAHCGRTKDFWEENNGQGISKEGRRFCCKPCADGKKCVCAEMNLHKGQELNNLQRTAVRHRR
jgi:hypothetical protein